MKIKGLMTTLGLGIALGGVAATAAGMMNNPSMKRDYKKKMNKTVKKMNNMLDDMESFFK